MLLLATKLTVAQDGVFKFKSVEISFTEINQNDSLLSLELYQNGIYLTNKSAKMGKKSNSNYDSLTNVYTLTYSYSGIGGGSDNRLRCPELFVKLSFNTKDNKKYFQLIPIVLSVCENSQASKIKALNINLNELLNQTNKMVLVSKTDGYQIVAKEEIKIGKLVKIE